MTHATKYNETILSGEVARKVMIAGITKIALAVKSTLGPDGRNVMWSRDGITAYVTKDGVTVARAASLPNRWENMVATLIREASANSESVAGDGTTTSVVLAEAMVQCGLGMITLGIKPNVAVRQLTAIVKKTKEHIAANTKRADTLEELLVVSAISANAEASGNYDLANMAANAVFKTGKYGHVAITKNHDDGDRLVYSNGYVIERGPHKVSQQYVANGDARHKKAYLVVTQDDMYEGKALGSLVEAICVATQTKPEPIVLMVGDIEDSIAAAATMAASTHRRMVYLMRALGSGSQQNGLMKDICYAAGTTVIPLGVAEACVTSPDQVGEHIGVVRDLVMGANTMSFEFDTNLDSYIKELEASIGNASSGFNAEGIRSRIARLTGGIAKILVGGYTDAERKERMEHYDDATKAVRVAFKDGVVMGGGYTLLEVANELKDTMPEIYYSFLKAPFTQILTNSWYTEPEIKEVYDAYFTEGKCCNILGGGWLSKDEYHVVDPVIVMTSALDNALSIAGLILLCDTMIGPKSNQENYGIK